MSRHAFVRKTESMGGGAVLEARLRPHLVMFLVCALPFLVGPLMQADSETATLAGMHGPVCPVRFVLPAAGCPGCGLTRAVVLDLHGDWSTSWQVHPAGLLVLALCLGGLLIHGDVLRRGRCLPFHRRFLESGRLLFVLGVMAAWSFRLAAMM